jgi:hypothetical protein
MRTISNVKLPANRAGLPGHAVASRMRAKEVSIILCPLTPSVPLGETGHVPAKIQMPNKRQMTKSKGMISFFFVSLPNLSSGFNLNFEL